LVFGIRHAICGSSNHFNYDGGFMKTKRQVKLSKDLERRIAVAVTKMMLKDLLPKMRKAYKNDTHNAI